MDAFIATTFFRHKRPLRALMIEGQAWFCLQDLGRLMGVPYPERRVHKLDSDQHRETTVRMDGNWARRVLVSESGAITLIVCNQIPENRELRRWLTHEVMPMLREGQGAAQPAISAMSCTGGPVKVLYWHDEPWVRLCDMPDVMSRPAAPVRSRWWPLRVDGA